MNLRSVFLRLIGTIYFFAFSSIYIQYQGLFGADGLEPVDVYFHHIQKKFEGESILYRVFYFPTLAWIHQACGFTQFPLECFFELLGVLGIVGSVLAMNGMTGAFLFSGLWLSYLSIVQCGQTFLSFQWDSMLLEVGFLALWLAPSRPSSHRTIWWLLRFTLFKLMFMAGMVKLQSGCHTWQNFTALEYHYATQCLPTPLAWAAHSLPRVVHHAATAYTFIVEGTGTFLILLPFRLTSEIALVMQLSFQFVIALTGNYTFFNFLTMVLCMPLLSTNEVSGIISSTKFGGQERRGLVLLALYFALTSVWMFDFTNPTTTSSLRFTPSVVQELQWTLGHIVLPGILLISTIAFFAAAVQDLVQVKGLKCLCGCIAITTVAAFVFMLSADALASLDPKFQHQTVRPLLPFDPSQVSPWRLSSPYGLFRHMTGVGKEMEVARPEIVLEGSVDHGHTWEPIHFKFKPGDIHTPPAFVAPHQPRLDWQMWFAALGSYEHNPWLIHLIDKLLEGSPAVFSLLDVQRNAGFLDHPPTFIRSKLYHYDFTRFNTSWNVQRKDVKTVSAKAWWTRTYVREYTPPLERGNPSVKAFLEAHGWTRDHLSNDQKLRFSCTCESLQESLECLLFHLISVPHRFVDGPFYTTWFLLVPVTTLGYQVFSRQPSLLRASSLGTKFKHE